MSTRVAKKKRNRSRKHCSWYWMATGALSAVVACSAGGGLPDAYGASGRAAAGALNWTQDVPALVFDIPPGPLGSVLESFRRITGIEITLSRDGLADLPSPGVRGSFTAARALDVLLSGTGVSYRFSGDLAVVLDLSRLMSVVDVTAELPPVQPSSPKYTEPLRDIPQTITVIPRDVIEQQGATTLRDVLTNVPGITLNAGEGGAPAGDNLTVRGFSARNDIFVDGVRDLGPQTRDAFNLEQVEVVKGPGSAYTGRGSTGGAINMVSKSPLIDPYYTGTLSMGNAGQRRITADLNTPLPALGERTAFRMNLMWSDGGVPGRDLVSSERWGAAPSLAFGIGTPTRLTLGYYHLQQDNISDYGVPWVPESNTALADHQGRPAPVPRDTFYGLVDRDFERMRSDLGTVSIERDVSDGVTFRNQLRFGRSTRDSAASPPRFAGNDTTAINRSVRAWKTEDDVWDNQTNFTAAFDTGAIRHALVTGMGWTRENNIRQNGRTGNTQTTLLDPDPYEPAYEPIEYAGMGDVSGNTIALYAFDTVSLSPQWELTGGLRWERFAVDGISTAGDPVERTDTMNSIRGGVVYKPAERGSIYASYATSLSPSLEGLSYQTANTAIEPEKTYNLEFGSKWEFAGSRLLLSGAVFRVEKTNARTASVLPDEPPQVLQGEQRAAGVELGASGSITRDWRVFGAYTFLDTEVLKSNNPAEVGRQIQNAPRNSANIWTTYQFGKLGLGGGARIVGRRYGNATNTRFVDRHWTADALISYALADNLDLRLNLYNLNNEYYYDRLGGGHVVPGPGRSIVLNTGFRF